MANASKPRYSDDPSVIQSRIHDLEARQQKDWKRGRVATIRFLRRRLAAAAIVAAKLGAAGIKCYKWTPSGGFEKIITAQIQ